VSPGVMVPPMKWLITVTLSCGVVAVAVALVSFGSASWGLSASQLFDLRK